MYWKPPKCCHFLKDVKVKRCKNYHLLHYHKKLTKVSHTTFHVNFDPHSCIIQQPDHFMLSSFKILIILDIKNWSLTRTHSDKLKFLLLSKADELDTRISSSGIALTYCPNKLLLDRELHTRSCWKFLIASVEYGVTLS